MIVDITGIELLPGNKGKDCPGNGEHKDNNGRIIDCCCDECSYMICCLEEVDRDECRNCEDNFCPFSGKNSKSKNMV